MADQTQTTARSDAYERLEAQRIEIKRLATLLFDARTALFREWVETGSETARHAYEATSPDKRLQR